MFKKTAGIVVVAVLLVSLLSGCWALLHPVTQAEAEDAFGASFAMYISAILTIGFGGSVPGVVLDDATGTMTLTDVDVTGISDSYTTMSGTFAASSGGTEIVVDLTLEGGPVIELSYTMTEQFFTDATNSVATSISVMANRQSFTINL